MSSTLQRKNVWLVCAVAAWPFAGWQPGEAYAAEAYPACTALQAGPTRTVTRIIDAETVVLDDGSELRLIGALAPRALDAGAERGQWPAELAAIEELRALLLGRSIELAFGGERTDRYGRWQAHAFWTDSDQRRWVQGRMLEQGLARAYTLAGNRAVPRSCWQRSAVAGSTSRVVGGGCLPGARARQSR